VDVVEFWTHFSVLCQLMNGSHKSRTLDFVQLMSQSVNHLNSKVFYPLILGTTAAKLGSLWALLLLLLFRACRDKERDHAKKESSRRS
jgi:hypothetical protein